MKEFDIYLGKRLKQCDIFVYSIPYRDGLTVIHRMILESCLDYYMLQKFVAGQVGSELEAHIDEMIKLCCEKLNCGFGIDASLVLSTAYALDSMGSSIELGPNEVHAVGLIFDEAANRLNLALEPLDVIYGTSMGEVEDIGLLFAQELVGTSKTALEKGNTSIPINTQLLGTHKSGTMEGSSSLISMADVRSLSYNIYAAGEAALQLAATLVDTEFHYSLGMGKTEVLIGANDVGGISMQAVTAAETCLEIYAELFSQLTQYIEPTPVFLSLQSSVHASLKQYALLSHYDEIELLLMDDEDLQTLTYIYTVD